MFSPVIIGPKTWEEVETTCNTQRRLDREYNTSIKSPLHHDNVNNYCPVHGQGTRWR